MELFTRVARVNGTQDWDSQSSMNTSDLSPELNLIDQTSMNTSYTSPELNLVDQTSVNTSYPSPELNLVDLSVFTDTGPLIPVLHSDESGSVLKAAERASSCSHVWFFYTCFPKFRFLGTINKLRKKILGQAWCTHL